MYPSVAYRDIFLFFNSLGFEAQIRNMTCILQHCGQMGNFFPILGVILGSLPTYFWVRNAPHAIDRLLLPR